MSQRTADPRRGEFGMLGEQAVLSSHASADEVLSPEQVRAAILRDHAEIRMLMQRLQQNVRRVEVHASEREGRRETGDRTLARDAQMNRDAARDLCARVLSHMAFEERVLVPALEQTDAWGPVRAARLLTEHEQQRAFVHQWLAALDQEVPDGAGLDVLVHTLLEPLWRDMQEEEEARLGPDLLVDVQVPLAVETG